MEHLGKLHIAGFRLKLVGLVAAVALIAGATACSPASNRTGSLPSSTHFHALTADGDRLVVVAHDGLYESDDAQNFKAIRPPRAHLLTAVRSGLLVVGGQTGGWVQSDGGWNQIPAFDGRVVQGLAAPTSGLVAWLIGAGLTTDRGVTQAPESGPDDGLAALAADGKELFAGGPNFGVYRSTDQGHAWTDMNAPRPATALYAGGGKLFMGSTDSVWQFTNTKWQRLKLDPAGPVAAITAWRSKLWVLSQAGTLVSSSDSGRTWRTVAVSG